MGIRVRAHIMSMLCTTRNYNTQYGLWMEMNVRSTYMQIGQMWDWPVIVLC